MQTTASAPTGGAQQTTEYAMWIDGAWTDSESGARLPATSPATGETIGSVPE